MPDLVWGDVDGITPISMVIRTAALIEVGGFDPELRGPEDVDLLVRLREGGYKFLVIPDIVMRRRYHGENLVAGHRDAPLPLGLLKTKLDRERVRAQETTPRPRQT